jgi:hypothetical protein
MVRISENIQPAPVALPERSERDRIITNRNVLFGLWAADRLGLAGAEREAYAMSVHFADLEAPGLDDVIAKVRRDFLAAGVEAGDSMLRAHLKEMQERAALTIDHPSLG